jgi:hypothetical protein
MPAPDSTSIPEIHRRLAKESFEEKIRKVGQLVRLVRAVPRPAAKAAPRGTNRASAA